MTRAVNATLLTAMGGEEAPLGWLMEIAMPDGSYRRMNSLGSVDITYGGNVFTGFPGFDPSQLTFTDGSGAPAVDMTQPLGVTGTVTFAEAANGLVSGLPVRLWVIDYEGGLAHEVGSKWYVGQVQTNDAGLTVFEIKSAERRNRQLFLRRYQVPCQHQLGDAGCGKDLTAFTFTATVVSVVDLFTLTVTISSPPADDYFNNGALKFNSGVLAGTAVDVRDWVQSTGTLKLFAPLKGTPQAGDTASVHAGCDKTTGAAGCARFDNVLRYFGFANLPDENLTFPQKTVDGGDVGGGAAPEPSSGGGQWNGTVSSSGTGVGGWG